MDQENKIQNKNVQTYAEDMAEAISGDQAGEIKKIIHAEEEHEALKKNMSPESKKNKLFMAVSFVLILVAMLLISYFYFTKTINTVPVEEQFTPLIFTDKSDFIEVSGMNKEKIAQSVSNVIKTTTVKTGGVEGIYLAYNKSVVGLRRFIELIKGNFTPDEKGANTNLLSDNFLMGTVNDGTNNLFILLKTRSTTDVFDALRAWEGKMFSDLQGFFGITLSAETRYLLTKNFDDGVIENKNARILRNTDGGVVMMYIFADDNSVIITNTEGAAHEIRLRLSGSQLEK